MGILDDLKRMLRRESADAREWLDDSVAGANRRLDEAERRQAADPEQRLQANLDDIAAGEDAFANIRARADAATARPQADAELREADLIEPPIIERTEEATEEAADEDAG
ncbi:hypothetical protein BH23ACT9_BH23ACT9_23570 [soil metagenome]